MMTVLPKVFYKHMHEALALFVDCLGCALRHQDGKLAVVERADAKVYRVEDTEFAARDRPELAIGTDAIEAVVCGNQHAPAAMVASEQPHGAAQTSARTGIRRARPDRCLSHFPAMVTPVLVPVIDIAPFTAGAAPQRQAVAAQVDAAARGVGFMQITGHGIPASVTAAMRGALDAFFALPLADKLVVRPSSVAINRGYSAPQSEHGLGGSGAGPVAAGVSGEPVAGRAAGVRADAVRVIRPLRRAGPHHDARRLGMGLHTDYGIVTILWADDVVPGLQVLDRTGAWHGVVPVSGALLVNLGDLLARWTNERWRSTMHRVLPPLDAMGRPSRRRSAAYFHDGNADAVIGCLPVCADATHPPLYPPVTVTEHLAAKLAGSRGLALNPDAQREAARLR